MLRIIDEKGRLFGKINIIDFLAVLFLLCSVPLFYFGYKLFTKNEAVITAQAPKEFTTLELKCKFIKVGPEILKNILVGDKEMNAGGEQIGELISVGADNPYQYIFNLGPSGEKLVKDDPSLREIPVILRLKAEMKDDVLYYKDKQITTDSSNGILFKTDKYALKAIPYPVREEREALNIELYVALKGLDKETIRLVSAGDKELDKKGNVIAEILQIGKIGNDTHTINLGGGNFAVGEDSVKKEIFVKMRLNVEITKNNQLFYKEKAIAVDTPFDFNTDKYTLKAKIVKEYEISPALSVKEKWLKVQVKFEGVIPELVNLINNGDLEKDLTGRTVAILKKIVSNKHSGILVLRGDRFTIIEHPFQRDMIVNLDCLTIEKEGSMYFKNYSTKIGNSIVFSTNLYSIVGTITGITND